jgi:hypothetical protein
MKQKVVRMMKWNYSFYFIVAGYVFLAVGWSIIAFDLDEIIEILSLHNASHISANDGLCDYFPILIILSPLQSTIWHYEVEGKGGVISYKLISSDGVSRMGDHKQHLRVLILKVCLRILIESFRGGLRRVRFRRESEVRDSTVRTNTLPSSRFH